MPHQYVISDNLANDHIIDVPNNRLYVESVFVSTGVPVGAPNPPEKRWFWFNSNTNKITHVWVPSASQWRLVRNGAVDIAALNTEYITDDTFLGKPVYVKVVDIIDGVAGASTPGTDQTLSMNWVYHNSNPSTSTQMFEQHSTNAAQVAGFFNKSNGQYSIQIDGTTTLDSARVTHRYTKI
jgi:hypothetical protein